MFKRFLTITTILFLSFLTAWFFIQAMKPETLPVGSTLPDLQYESSTGIESIHPDHRPFIVLWFHEDCDHCIYQMKLLDKYIDELKGIHLYLLTSDRSFIINRRERLYPRLSSEYSVHWGFMTNSHFKKLFGSTARPTMYFFDREGYFFQKITGEMKISGILKIIDSMRLQAGDPQAEKSFR